MGVGVYCQQVARLGQKALDLLAANQVADVARDYDRADDLAVRASHRRDAEGYVNVSAVLTAPNGLELVDRLAALQAREDLLRLAETLRRGKNADRLADYFVGAITVQVLRARVPALDRAVERLAEDGIVEILADLD